MHNAKNSGGDKKIITREVKICRLSERVNGLTENLQKLSCRTKLEKFLCLKTVGIIWSENFLMSFTINVSPFSDHPPKGN